VTALNNAHGPDKVLAVVSTGIPYSERSASTMINVLAADSGTVGHPFVLLARGSVTLEASDTTSAWSPVPNNSTMWRTHVAHGTTFATQVFLNGVPYPYVDAPDSIALPNLPAGRSKFILSADSFYVNFGAYPNWQSVNPTGTTGQVSVRNAISVQGSNVTIHGFTIRRSNSDGVNISGPVRNVIVENCDVRKSFRQGIMPNSATSHHCIIQDNLSSENGSYGIIIPDANTDFSILRNTCTFNADPAAWANKIPGRSSVNGIRLGEGTWRTTTRTRASRSGPTTRHAGTINRGAIRTTGSITCTAGT
jgi:hypothetical protein